MKRVLHCRLDLFQCQARDDLSAEEYKQQCDKLEANLGHRKKEYTQADVDVYAKVHAHSRAERFPLGDNCNDRDFELIMAGTCLA